MINSTTHPSGKIITYNGRFHTYYIEGKPSIKFISVTTLINKFFQEFNALEISEKYAKKHNLDAKEVRREWKEKGDKARHRGKLYHKYAEECLHNNSSVNLLCDNITKYIDKKIKELYKSGYTPICSECIVASLELRVAGTIDFLMKKDDTLLIGDWKFIDELNYTNIWRNARFPIQHLPDTNYYKYALQLSFYKYIIQREKYFPELNRYEIKLYQINDSGLNEKTVPDYTKEIKQMVAQYEKEKDV